MRRTNEILFRTVLGVLLLIPGLLSGASLSEISEQGKAEARKALSDLRQFRLQVEKEQIPLEENISDLRARLSEAREKLSSFRDAADSSEVTLADLESETERLAIRRSTVESIADEIIGSYANSPQHQLDPGVQEDWQEWTASEDHADRLVIAAGILEKIIAGLHSEIGGDTMRHSIYLSGGLKSEGTALSFGPLLYFVTDDGQAGIVDTADPSLPKLIISSAEEADEIRQTMRDQSGLLPVDPTGGAALALRKNKQGFLGEILQAGIWIYPILFAGLVAAIVAIVKWITISRTQRSARKARSRFVRIQRARDTKGKDDFLLQQPELLRSFWDLLWKTGNFDAESRDDLIYARLIEIRLRLTKGLSALSVIAATAPLLGLLGTVTGMIATFQQITLFGQADPQNLSGGISEALLTTKFGLMVAIPTFLIYAYLSRKAQGTVSDLESFSRQIEAEPEE